MKSKLIKIVSIISIIAIILAAVGIGVNNVQAKELTANEKKQIYSGDTAVYDMGTKIVSYVTYGCYAAAVIVLLVKGVKFMKAAPEGKAQIKEEMIAAAIGALILFAIGSFIKIISDIALNKVFK